MLSGRIAATMHAGTFGQLLETVTEKPAPEVQLPQQSPENYGQIMVRGYFAGLTQAEIREKMDALSSKQHQRRTRKVHDLYGARTSSHLIRRVVEVDGGDLLPPRRITYGSQSALARILSPRQIVHWGLLSYGLAHPTIENLFNVTTRTVDRTVEDTKAVLGLPHNTTEFVLAQFFADEVLKPDDKYLPHDYVVGSLTAVCHAMHDLVVPPELLPEGRYPWVEYRF